MNEQTVYNLARTFGKPGDIYSWVKTANTITGIATITRTRYAVKRLARLPQSTVRKMARFSQGGTSTFTYEITDALFLVRKADLGVYEPMPEDYVIQAGMRWNIISVDAYSYSGAFVLHSRHVEGENLGQVLSPRIKDVLSLSESMGGVT